ncbi:hypothetical protein GUJ93_ZPchr0002g23924 [Zizania palustris]|uniref:Uncharacterized protein n=1 Tax=Zizania palustris TaxID=103762 RepID=A0A8J5RHM6_ZIZPA|nr:hypothetical protein GUJ93_ZPchr0002g23924 [Zizania palustris]
MLRRHSEAEGLEVRGVDPNEDFKEGCEAPDSAIFQSGDEMTDNPTSTKLSDVGLNHYQASLYITTERDAPTAIVFQRPLDSSLHRSPLPDDRWLVHHQSEVESRRHQSDLLNGARTVASLLCPLPERHRHCEHRGESSSNRFRMTKPMFKYICDDVESANTYFKPSCNAAHQPGFHTIQKLVVILPSPRSHLLQIHVHDAVLTLLLLELQELLSCLHLSFLQCNLYL